MDLVYTTCSIHIQASLMRIVIFKLKATNLALIVWNKQVYGNLDHIISIASAILTGIEKWHDYDSFFEELLQVESIAHVEFDRLLHQQDFFGEKIIIKWLNSSDREITQDFDMIDDHMLVYYDKLFSSQLETYKFYPY